MALGLRLCYSDYVTAEGVAKARLPPSARRVPPHWSAD